MAYSRVTFIFGWKTTDRMRMPSSGADPSTWEEYENWKRQNAVHVHRRGHWKPDSIRRLLQAVPIANPPC